MAQTALKGGRRSQETQGETSQAKGRPTARDALFFIDSNLNIRRFYNLGTDSDILLFFFFFYGSSITQTQVRQYLIYCISKLLMDNKRKQLKYFSSSRSFAIRRAKCFDSMRTNLFSNNKQSYN